MLSEIAAHLPEELKTEVLGKALAAAREITDERARAEALSGIAAHLPEALKKEVLAAAQGIRDERVHVRELLGIAAHLPEELQAAVLAAAREITDERMRTEALLGIAAHLPEGLKGEALGEAFLAVTGGRRHLRSYGESPYTDIVTAWQESGSGEIGREVWSWMLHRIACDRRDQLLQDLGALAPLIQRLGGQEAVGETLCAILDVSRWWP